MILRRKTQAHIIIEVLLQTLAGDHLHTMRSTSTPPSLGKHGQWEGEGRRGRGQTGITMAAPQLLGQAVKDDDEA